VQKTLERLGIALSRHDLDQVYRHMVALADERKHITDNDLIEIASKVSALKAASETTPH
jgi:isopropylmalate/homocitrate/citramalate synthase